MMIESAVREIIEQKEQEIAARFQEMLANDAMIELELNLSSVERAESDNIRANFRDSYHIVLSNLDWNGEHDHFFVMEQQVSTTLLDLITQANEAIDNLDVVFENWTTAATQSFEDSLESPPKFEAPESVTRGIQHNDIPTEGVIVEYELVIGDNKLVVHRFAPKVWQDMVEAANLEVTTVDDVAMDMPGDEEELLDEDGVEIEQAAFGPLSEDRDQSDGPNANISMLYDLNLDLIVELGRTKKQIREILEFGKGSVIELDKLAGDTLEIFVNGRKLAEGEVVVVDDHFGIRITNLVRQSERIRSLGVK